MSSTEQKLNRTWVQDTGCRHDFVRRKVRLDLRDCCNPRVSILQVSRGQRRPGRPSSSIDGSVFSEEIQTSLPNLWARGIDIASKTSTVYNIRCMCDATRFHDGQRVFNAILIASADPDGRIHQSFSHHTIKEGATFILCLHWEGGRVP